jgi:serine/threonine protein kinase
MPEELSGWLYKAQRVFPAKKKRYFKLASQVLSSHVKNTADPSWEQNLLGAEVVGAEPARRITVHCADRTVRLFPETPGDYFHWLDALQKAASRRIEDFYELGQSLGEGAFAKVVMGLDRSTLEKFAVKIIDKQSDDELGAIFVWREMNCLLNINHPNIVRTYDIFDTKNRLYIVLEYMPGGTLGEILKKLGRFSEAQARPILHDILSGVAYLHEKSIVHRDLKLKNILCETKEMPVRVKLADFGLANFVGVRTVSKVALQSQVGSPHYVLVPPHHPFSSFVLAKIRSQLPLIYFIYEMQFGRLYRRQQSNRDANFTYPLALYPFLLTVLRRSSEKNPTDRSLTHGQWASFCTSCSPDDTRLPAKRSRRRSNSSAAADLVCREPNGIASAKKPSTCFPAC